MVADEFDAGERCYFFVVDTATTFATDIVVRSVAGDGTVFHRQRAIVGYSTTAIQSGVVHDVHFFHDQSTMVVDGTTVSAVSTGERTDVDTQRRAFINMEDLTVVSAGGQAAVERVMLQTNNNRPVSLNEEGSTNGDVVLEPDTCFVDRHRFT